MTRTRVIRAALDAASLGKAGIAAASACAAAAGYLAANRGGPVSGAAWCAAAVFLLAAGAGALNNWQDRIPDAYMARTRRRPIPSGRIRPAAALALGAALVCAGAAVIAPVSTRGLAAGILAVALYNGLYTPLKSRTLWAIVPGIAAGALPPAIGWLAAGGAVSSPVLWYLAAVFGVWQLPHLWIIILTWRGDCAAPGVYGFVSEMGPWCVSRLVFLWVFCLAVLMTYAPIFGIVRSAFATVLILANALFLVLYFISAASGDELKTSGFALLNGSLLAHIIIIAASGVMG